MTTEPKDLSACVITVSVDESGSHPHCPACGRAVAECTDSFCRYCRQDLRPLHNRFCRCGYSSLEYPHPHQERRFCPLCGQKTTLSRPLPA